jgi:hypothetical protein
VAILDYPESGGTAMRSLRHFTLATTIAAALLVIPSDSAQGLYGDPGKDVTTGDLNNQDYWRSKYDAMMLELAIKQHQPEGRIAVDVEIFLRRLADLSKKYPKHQEIAKWKARVEEVASKVNPNADRRASFESDCPWDESNFAQLWVNLHWAKVAFDAKDYATALSCMQNVMQNYQIMLAPDRMKHYPEDLRKYVVDSKPDADKLYKAVKEKTNR